MEGMTEMTARRKVTIRQVAEQAGVSVGTVSNYLNGKTAVSKERAEKIQRRCTRRTVCRKASL